MYAGLDVSTKAVSVVLLREDGGFAGCCEFPLPALRKLDGNQAARVRSVLRSGLKVYLLGATRIYIEQPMGQFVGSVAKIERIVGVCLACVPPSSEAHIIDPQDWRRVNGLASKAPKADVEAFIDYHYPQLKGKSEDLHDAAAVARAAYLDYSKADL